MVVCLLAQRFDALHGLVELPLCAHTQPMLQGQRVADSKTGCMMAMNSGLSEGFWLG